jgi:hypothetical protein
LLTRINLGVRLIPAADPAFVAGTLGANLLVIQLHTARGNLATLSGSQKLLDVILLCCILAKKTCTKLMTILNFSFSLLAIENPSRTLHFQKI